MPSVSDNEHFSPINIACLKNYFVSFLFILNNYIPLICQMQKIKLTISFYNNLPNLVVFFHFENSHLKFWFHLEQLSLELAVNINYLSYVLEFRFTWHKTQSCDIIHSIAIIYWHFFYSKHHIHEVLEIGFQSDPLPKFSKIIPKDVLARLGRYVKNIFWLE